MPTIAQAQAAFLRSGGFQGGTDKGNVYVVKSGKNKADFSKVSGNLGIVQAMIAGYIADFMEMAQDNLRKTDSVTTGNLIDSINFELTTTASGYHIDFTVLDYYKFVDQGVRGAGASRKNNTSPFKFKFINPSKSHVTAIEKWIILNRLTATARDVGKYGAIKRERKAISPTKGRRSLAYAIATAMKKDGLYETGFWSDAFEETFKDFGVNLSKALGKTITINLQQVADQFKKGKGINIPR